MGKGTVVMASDRDQALLSDLREVAKVQGDELFTIHKGQWKLRVPQPSRRITITLSDGRKMPCDFAVVVWVLTHGRWPTPGLNICHNDGDHMNNAPGNLREDTVRANQAVDPRVNRSKYGSCIYRHGNKYLTQVLVNNKRVGSIALETVQEAKEACNAITDYAGLPCYHLDHATSRITDVLTPFMFKRLKEAVDEKQAPADD